MLQPIVIHCYVDNRQLFSFCFAHGCERSQEHLEIYLVAGTVSVEGTVSVHGYVANPPVPGELPSARDLAETLPPGRKVEDYAAILGRLPGRQRLCLWFDNSVPPGSIESPELSHLDDSDREYHADHDWHWERWSAGWIDIFPSHRRRRTPLEEIVRQWSIILDRKAHISCPEADAYWKAMPPLDAVAELERDWCWDKLVEEILFSSPPSVGPALLANPIGSCLVNRVIRWFVDTQCAGAPGLADIRQSIDFIEGDVLPRALAALRLVAESKEVPARNDAIRILLLLGNSLDRVPLPQPESLDLSRWPLTDAMMARLATINSLRELDLSYATLRFQNSQLHHLSSLTQLRKLNLAGLCLTCSDLRVLRSFPNLIDLNLMNQDLSSDACASQIVRAISLRKLDLRGSSISAGAREIIRQRLPNCEVVFT